MLKLWVFYPPTENNIKEYKKAAPYTARLHGIWKKLEGGLWAAVGDGEACYIPAGWLHATYSMDSSWTVGTTLSSAESLLAVVDILVTELQFGAEIRVTAQADLYFFLESLVQALIRGLYDDCREAMKKICPQRLQVEGKSGPLLGSSWNLKTGSSRAQIKTLVASVKEGISNSKCPEGFWRCDKPTCGLLLGHIS
jgi:hypothetical protein